MAEGAVQKKGPIIAIDGPAGTGKSTATRRLAEKLGFVHVDTGALYRALAHVLIHSGQWPEGVTPETLQDADRLAAQELAGTIELEFKFSPRRNPKNRIYANGKDVTPFIRTPEVSLAASAVSGIPAVRASLLALQRKLGCQGASILEGRDIGTVVFPDADLKFFLSASVEERAKRRLDELEATGADVPSFEEIKAQIAARDHADSTRKVAPLKKALDAIEVDTTHLTLDQVVERLLDSARDRLGLRSRPGA
ncbi:MAG: (d)CMP kinase [Oligoflexia bacterium]